MSTQNELNKLDQNYRRHCPLVERVVIALFRKQVNSVSKAVICRAFERSKINSTQLHELCGICDRILWPERPWDCQSQPSRFQVFRFQVYQLLWGWRIRRKA